MGTETASVPEIVVGTWQCVRRALRRECFQDDRGQGRPSSRLQGRTRAGPGSTLVPEPQARARTKNLHTSPGQEAGQRPPGTPGTRENGDDGTFVAIAQMPEWSLERGSASGGLWGESASRTIEARDGRSRGYRYVIVPVLEALSPQSPRAPCRTKPLMRILRAGAWARNSPTETAPRSCYSEMNQINGEGRDLRTLPGLRTPACPSCWTVLFPLAK